MADKASERFAAEALDYDRYRPRYPESVFDDIVESAGLAPGDLIVEIGAGTGIATQPLVDLGFSVIAIEPSESLAAIAASHVSERAQIVVGRFEEFLTQSPVRLITAFNAWHWIDPRTGVDLAADLIEPGGLLALVWTEVVEWGQQPFEDRLTEVFGHAWKKREDHVDGSLKPVREDPRFDDVRGRHHVFDRTLDASTFVAVTKTYGGSHTEEQYQTIERIINDDFGGSVTKVEAAALYLTRRH